MRHFAMRRDAGQNDGIAANKSGFVERAALWLA
jgi:hypothetical protein